MRTLVTGGSGLVGRHLRPLLPGATFVSSAEYDLTKHGQVDELLYGGRWDRVIHLPALVGGILDNKTRPSEYLEQNLLMNTYFVRRCREEGIERLTVMLSSCIYPADPQLYAGQAPAYPMHESQLHHGEPCRSNYGYAVAKRTLATQVDLAVQQDPSLKWNYLIACNLYGEGDKDDPIRSHFVTALLRKIREANAFDRPRVELLGDGTPHRQFMHAGDLARVIKRMVDEDITESFNVCPPGNPTIREIAETALRATRSERLELRFSGSEMNGEHRKDVSNAKMMYLMPGFEFTPLEDGIRRAYEHG